MDLLPQELIDEIINCLPSYDKESLKNCSLVSGSWKNTSQKRLFESVITRPRKLRSWLDGVSRDNGALFKHVHRLSCTDELFYATCPKELENGTLHLRDYLPFLCQLRHFGWCRSYIHSSPQVVELFSAFQNTLSRIDLSYCRVSTNLLVTLIKYFPNLEHLSLNNLSYFASHEQTSPFSRPSLKKLYVSEGTRGFLNVLGDLSELGLRFNEIALGPSISSSYPWTTLANCVVRAFGTSAERLRLPQIHSDMWHPERLVLSPCRKLRELEFEVSAYPLREKELDIVSSITSTNIEKIIINRRAAFYPVGDVVWTQLDNILTELAEKSEHNVRLKVEFRGGWIAERKEFDQKSHLPKLIGKGQVTIWDGLDKLIYCSDALGTSR